MRRRLILPKIWQNRLTIGTVGTLPSHNIRAGVAYLLMRSAVFDYKSIVDPASAGPYKVTVRAGDSFARIAKQQGSTIDILKNLNGPSSILKPGQVLLVEKGVITRVISTWRRMSTASIAQRYNGGGDPLYARKLDYAFGAVLVQTPSSFAAGAEKVEECVAGSQAEVRSCLEKTSLASAVTLAAAEQAAMSALSRWDEDEKYRQSATAVLHNSSKFFSECRQAQCDFFTSLGGGAIGNALALRRLRCVTDLNQRQAEMLRVATFNLLAK